MKPEQIKKLVLDALIETAPELDPETLASDVEFRDQIDIDSMDMLNFVTALHRRIGVNVPDSDFPQLASLDACVEYLAKRVE